MKKYTSIPAHYRQVTTGTIRKGDLKKTDSGMIRKVTGSIGKSVTADTSTVWRRSHVAIKGVPTLHRLGDTELVLAGDSWAYAHTPNTIVGQVTNPIAGLVAGRLKKAYVYHRKTIVSLVEAKKTKVAAAEKNPLVTFSYPISKQPWNEKLRKVRVIAANSKYIIGLEVSDKNRFKKFLKTKTSQMSLVEYSTGSMP